ncbi:carbohydrate esterase family 16 protein [Laetiporus sulphureus 93-53]|uniref:Carbohydrate esterase family 16 protein n=1 Tax=Laetiporus sulphureus 93-53 TaxID=1314785 RepID=A0A165BMQ8_9APHY|nr:carbohydrate esterase family 16 protein [Laetiporus sulphureus 93-53]KZT01321.1 carbohydrate esterase family 16 protein [Laetiporus sulphureus 93-53]
MQDGKSRLNASCYSVAGSTVEDDLECQLERFFEQYPKKKTPDSKPPLDANKSLYVLWVGTNDCGQADPSDLEDIVDSLFANGLDELYVKAGARNFLLIDVPPNERSPAATILSTDISKQYLMWNELLNERARLFAQESKNASVFLFSANAVISAILDAPDEYGFEEEDIFEEGGPIWLDDMHLTSDVHAIIAEKLEKALHSVPCGSA